MLTTTFSGKPHALHSPVKKTTTNGYRKRL